MKFTVIKPLRAGITVSILSLCAHAAFGQQVLTPGVVVTGQCQGHGGEPGCALPNLFGSTGLSLYPNPGFPHYAHYIGSAQTTLNQTLSTAIATQLAILPIISPSSGFTYQYDSAAGAFVRSTTSFGPIYAERAETEGRGKLSFGVSYQRFRFSSLDGIDLHNIPAVFSHLPNTGPNNTSPAYEADVVQTRNDVSLNMDSTMLYGTIGITDRVDFSVAIPIVSVRMSAAAERQTVCKPKVYVEGGDTDDNGEDGRRRADSKRNSSGRARGLADLSRASVLYAEVEYRLPASHHNRERAKDALEQSRLRLRNGGRSGERRLHCRAAGISKEIPAGGNGQSGRRYR